MDRGGVGECVGVVVDTLVGVCYREIDDGFRENSDGYFTGVGTLTLVIVDKESYGIGSGLSETVLWFEAVVYRRSISEVPGIGGVVFNGIGRQIFKDE